MWDLDADPGLQFSADWCLTQLHFLPHCRKVLTPLTGKNSNSLTIKTVFCYRKNLTWPEHYK